MSIAQIINSESGASIRTKLNKVIDIANTASGSYVFTGSFNAYTGSTSSSFAGTSSYALTASYLDQAATASYALTASYLSGSSVTSSYALTASYVTNAFTASYLTGSATASYSLTSSYLDQAATASYALTASYLSGSSLTASYALTASYVDLAFTASYLTGSATASYALTASYLSGSSLTASYALTASYVENAFTASYLTGSATASYSLTSSYLDQAATASYALTASYVTNAITASYLSGSAESSSYALTASYLDQAATASYSLSSSLAESSSFSVSASYSVSSSNSSTSSYSLESYSGSNANTASLALNTELLEGKNYATLIHTGSVGGSQSITGSLIITQNLTVSGSASFAYVTSSQTLLDNNAITVQALGLSVPSGGLVVIDSSSIYSSSALMYNVVTEKWNFSKPVEATLIGTASWAITSSYLDQSATASYALTASYLSPNSSASYALTASHLDTPYITTASLSGSYLVFTKGDGTTYNIDLSGSQDTGSSSVYAFPTASTQWDINHNLNQPQVSVTVYNSQNLEIEASEISASNSNNVSVFFTYPVSGYALVLSRNEISTVGSSSTSASYAATASYLLGSIESASFATTASYVESSSYALTSSYVNTLLQGVDITGSLFVSGNINNIGISRGLSDDQVSVAVGAGALGQTILSGADGGRYNTALGDYALGGLNSGWGNTGMGSAVMSNNLNGTQNTAIGFQTMFFDALGDSNTAIGSRALHVLGNSQFISQTGNTALGTDAGRWITVNASTMNQASSSIFIGHNSRALGNAQTNQIVIGANAQGGGSNTVTIGNTLVTKTFLRGTVSASLFTGSFQANGSSSQTGSGIFLNSPNGTRYKLVVDNSGVLTTVVA